jgi:hypothetical protein
VSDRRKGGPAGADRREKGDDADPSHGERSPFPGGWPLLYGVVLLNLAVLIALFTWFTHAFE